jgi:hypothetical protein
MQRLSAIAFALIAGVSGVCAGPSQYVCTVEHTTGLHYDKQAGMYGTAPFVAGAKFVMRKITDDDRDHQKGKWWALYDEGKRADDDWAFFEFGKPDPLPLATCRVAFGARLACERLIFDAEFDLDSRRFELVSRGGYISQGFWEQFRREHPEEYKHSSKNGTVNDPSKPDDLFIAIGRCSPS